MLYVLTGVHIVVSFFLIVVVLLQSGQVADLAGAFGGMGSQTVFGPRGSATVMSRATTTAAVIFMLTSLALAIIGGKRMAANSGSVVDTHLKNIPATAPAKPATSIPAPIQAPASPIKVTPASPTSQAQPFQQPNVSTKVLQPGEKVPVPAKPKAPPKN